jgi:hypothetical protein
MSRGTTKAARRTLSVHTSPTRQFWCCAMCTPRRGSHAPAQGWRVEKMILHSACTRADVVAVSLPPLWGRVRVGGFRRNASQSARRTLHTVATDPPPKSSPTRGEEIDRVLAPWRRGQKSATPKLARRANMNSGSEALAPPIRIAGRSRLLQFGDCMSARCSISHSSSRSPLVGGIARE